MVETSNILSGWREEEYGRSRGGLPLRVQLPVSGAPVEGLLIATQHGEEAETGLLARRLLERIPGTRRRGQSIQVANPDGLMNGTRQNAAGVDLNRNFPCASWSPDPRSPSRPGSTPSCGSCRTAPAAPRRPRAGVRAGDARPDGTRPGAAAAARARPARSDRADPRPRGRAARARRAARRVRRAARRLRARGRRRPAPSTSGCSSRGSRRSSTRSSTPACRSSAFATCRGSRPLLALARAAQATRGMR